MGATYCKRCGEEIIWLTLPDKKRIPVDPLKVEFVSRTTEGDLFLAKGRVAHWETCANPIEEAEDADL